jgi:hypothetical protein
MRMVGTTGTFKGVVSKVYSPANHDVVILDFDPDYHIAMTAVIEPDYYRLFPSLKSLLGKPLVVTGEFQYYERKLQIDVTSPSQIKIVAQGSTSATGAALAANVNDDWASAPEIKVAGGLTVIAASDEASVNWFPIKGASTYAVKRTTMKTADPQTVAAGLTSQAYFDRGLRPSEQYEYVLCGYDKKGTAIARETADVEPERGATVFVDGLTDWSNADDHSSNLEFIMVEGMPFIKRTSTTTATVTYNLPGAVDVSFDVRYHGDFDGKVVLETSKDGDSWSTQALTHTDPLPAGSGDNVAVCSAASLPARTNFLRISLTGDDIDTMYVGAVRATYGRTTSTVAP